MKKKIAIVMILITLMLPLVIKKASANNGFWYNLVGSTIEYYEKGNEEVYTYEIKNEDILENGDMLSLKRFNEQVYRDYWINYEESGKFNINISFYPGYVLQNNYLEISVLKEIITSKIIIEGETGGEMYSIDLNGTGITEINSNVYTKMSNIPIIAITLFDGIFFDQEGTTEVEISYLKVKSNIDTSGLLKQIEELERRLNDLFVEWSDLDRDYNDLIASNQALFNEYQDLLKDYNNLANDKVSLTSLILTYVDIPFKVISGFLGFEVFGIELFSALSGVLTMLVILWIIKKVMK